MLLDNFRRVPDMIAGRILRALPSATKTPTCPIPLPFPVGFSYLSISYLSLMSLFSGGDNSDVRGFLWDESHPSGIKGYHFCGTGSPGFLVHAHRRPPLLPRHILLRRRPSNLQHSPSRAPKHAPQLSSPRYFTLRRTSTQHRFQ